MANEIGKAVFEEEFRVCPACGYMDGFHTMLKKEGDKIKWLFICPSCHQIFDIGMAFDRDSIFGNESQD